MEKSSFTSRDCVINPDYRGVCAVYHGFSYMPQSHAMGLRDRALEREFERVEAMRLKIARTWFRPDFDRERLLCFIRWLEKMKELGVEVALQGGWWFPLDVWYFAHERYNDRTLTDSAENFACYCDKFAAWIGKALEYFILVRKCTNIRYLCLFSEPTTVPAGNLPQGITVREAYALCCAKVKERLAMYGLTDQVKLVGPNALFADYQSEALSLDAAAVADTVDIYAGHAYAATKGNIRPFVMTGYDGWLSHAQYLKKQFGGDKPVWFDEYGLCGDGAESLRDKAWYGNFIAQAACAFANGGLQTSFLWLLFDCKHAHDVTNGDSFYHGVHRWGTAYMPGDTVSDSENVRPSWYVVSMLSRYLCGYTGGIVFQSEFDRSVCGCVTEPHPGQTTALIVNRTGSPRTVCVDLTSRPESTFTVYCYDPQKIVPQKEQYLLSGERLPAGNRFDIRLPPYGVAVCTDYDGDKPVTFPDPVIPEMIQTQESE